MEVGGWFTQKLPKIYFCFDNMKANLQEIIRQTLQAEAETLSRLAIADFAELERAIGTIRSMDGRVVLTGIGKSAIAARKICATLNSTGTPSLFLHAADASHGDLGAVQRGDVVLVISKSGGSQELLNMMPHLKQNSIPIIAFVSSETADLAVYADHTIYIPVVREADPNGVAPTSSTIAHIAVGDALALALQQLSGWSVQSFAGVHPGGTLGKQLNLQLSDLHPENKSPSVATTDTIKQTIIAMSAGRMGAVAVIESGHVVGIVTDGDLRRMLESHESYADLTARDIMTPQPKFATKDMLAFEALELMETHNISQLIVQQDTVYIGMVHLHDLLSVGF